jgi:hypothetical protein
VLNRLVDGIQVSAKARHADAAEDAEDVALVLVELRGRFAAEGEELVVK